MTQRPPRWRVWAFAIVLGLFAGAVKQRYLVGFDHALARQAHALRAPAVDAAVHALAFFGSSLWFAAVLAALGAWWWSKGQRTTLLVCAGAGVLGVTIEMILRLLVGQWRPDSGVVSAPTGLISRLTLAGFPSGHAFRSAFLYGWLAQVLKGSRAQWARLGVAACSVLILAVGWTRVYLGRHWGSDVIGGWLVAMTVLTARPPGPPRARAGAGGSRDRRAGAAASWSASAGPSS